MPTARPSATGALLALGETRSRHSGVIAAFGELLVVGEGLDPSTGRGLRVLFERRAAADYALEPIRPDEARRRIEQARSVVEAVEAWLREHG